MAQETHYYNNVIAQLVELRKDMVSQGESNQDQLNQKFDDVIDAIKKIQVTTDNIRVEAGTINLSTDEVEDLLRTVNTNLGIINDNLDEFDINTKTQLIAFADSVKEQFTNLSAFLTNLTTDIGNNNITLINKLESNRIDLNTNLKDNTDVIVNDITEFKDTNHTDLVSIKDELSNLGVNDTTALAKLDMINTNIDEEFTALKTNDNTNNDALIEKLNAVLDIFGPVHPVYGGPDVPILQALLGYLECTNMNDFRQVSIGTQLSTFDMHVMSYTDIALENFSTIAAYINKSNSDSNIRLDKIIAAIGDNSQPPVEGSMAAILTDIHDIINSNSSSIVDAINAVKVTADNIKIDAGTINLSTDEVEDLLKTANNKFDTINDTINNILNNNTNINSIMMSLDNIIIKFDLLLAKMDLLTTAVNNITNNGTHSIVMVENE